MPELIVDPQDGSAPLRLAWTEGFGVQPGPLGLGLPPRRIVERDRPDGRGADLVAALDGPREVTIPLDVYGPTRAEFLYRRRRLQTICGRSRPGRPLRVLYVEDDGRVEWIEGVYVGGLEGDEQRGDDRSELFAVVLRDGNPYWRGDRVDVSWDVDRPAANPWFPLIGRYPVSSIVGGRRTVVNPSDVEVFAPWVIHGPGTRLLLTNRTAGWSVDIEHVIPPTGPGSYLTILTEPGSQSVRDGFDVNLFGKIVNGPAGGWEMGPLLPGPNVIEVRLDGSRPGAFVQLSYDRLLLAV